jgi:NitT/TauT family transport system substrate-binding protein
MSLQKAGEWVQALVIGAAGMAGIFLFHQWREGSRSSADYEITRKDDSRGRQVLHLGYFPAVTHAQAILGVSQGTFQRALGPDIALEATPFNAGPEAVEAIFAGSLDMAYVGANPAINAHVRSKGGGVRIIAGSASGGAALVVRGDANILSASDLRGKRLATPQLGNTQDVAARSWLLGKGLVPGKDVDVVPLKNPDQLAMMKRKDLDAVWTVEPWVSRLVREAGGRVFLDERELWPGGAFATTVLLVNTRYLKEHPDLIRRWLKAHVELTQWVLSRPDEARRIVNQELGRITGKALPDEVIADSFARIQFTWDPLTATIAESARRAFLQDFLGKVRPDLSGITDLRLLNEVLRDAGLAPLQ